MFKPKESKETIYIDSKDYHLDDTNSVTIHPERLTWLRKFEKEAFDKGVVMNTPTSLLTALGFFYLLRVIKENGTLEVLVDQQISVMQEMEASEIQVNATLGGFVDVQVSEYEKFLTVNGKDVELIL